MNKLLELKGTFNQASRPRPVVFHTLPPKRSVTISDINRLTQSLEKVYRYWRESHSLFKPLVSLYYKDIVAKSNRMINILSYGSESPNATIVGAKFTDTLNPKHIITHCVSIRTFEQGLEKLRRASQFLTNEFNTKITAEEMDILNNNTSRLKRELSREEISWKTQKERALTAHGLSKSAFCQIMKDAWYIDFFKVEERNIPVSESQIITLYDTGLRREEILKNLGLQQEPIRTLDDLTWMVTPEQYYEIISKAPYLVAMTVSDFGRIDARSLDGIGNLSSGFSIPEPTNEPVIGVIDTLFDQSSYFSSWVEYHCMISPDLVEDEDYAHGTAVSSILVDGPSLNGHLDDGCGRFRVRHFGVAKHARNSSAYLMNAIRSIVETNKDIKVWNISLGSSLEADQNFISPEAALLDELQFLYDIIFVVAGTNNRNRRLDRPRIGSPADSVNSVVVNAVTLAGDPVEYARKGPVLHFFNKPDVAVFGGDSQDGMIVYSNRGRVKELGTSFAAPWIARKLAYLIHVMNFPREIAKALLLDSAAGWKVDSNSQNLKGFGVVPTKIQDILSSPNEEIRFVVHGVVEAYETYAYTIPVPLCKDQFPYIAKATLCYFPKCSRSQGVDYTDTEMDIHLGRMNKKGKITAINANAQGDDEPHRLFEKEVRRNYRKWDTVKHIYEEQKARNRPRIRLSESSPNWGINIKTKERLETKSGKGLHFGVVITLHEITGVNRISEFMQLCRANNWFVNEVDIHARIEIHEKAEVEVEFDEDQVQEDTFLHDPNSSPDR